MAEYYEHKLEPAGVKPEWLEDHEYIDFLDKGGKWDDAGTFDHDASFAIDRSTVAIRIPHTHWAVKALEQGKVPQKPTEPQTEYPPEMESVPAPVCCGCGKSPELVERIRTAKEAAHLISIVDQGCGGTMTFAEMVNSAVAQAKGLEGHLDAILAELEPVDPDVALAREIAAGHPECDREAATKIALFAIKRIRAQGGAA